MRRILYNLPPLTILPTSQLLREFKDTRLIFNTRCSLYLGTTVHSEHRVEVTHNGISCSRVCFYSEMKGSSELILTVPLKSFACKDSSYDFPFALLFHLVNRAPRVDKKNCTYYVLWQRPAGKQTYNTVYRESARSPI